MIIRARTILPVCKFPTTIVLVDDDDSLLETLTNNLEEQCLIKAFSNPYEAQKYLNDNCSKDILKEKHINILSPSSLEEVVISVNYTNLSMEVNNLEKTHVVSTLIIDYDMPGINGLEICQSINDPNLIKILLSGNIRDKDVINAFNQGVIDGYIDKYNLNLTSCIMDVVETSEEHYFDKLSAFCAYAILLDKSRVSFLGTAQYIAFFKQLVKEHQIIEYYLIDSIGNYLLKSKNGGLLALYIGDEESFKAMLEVLPEGVPDSLISEIKLKKKMFCYSEIESISISNVINYVHPAHNIPGIKGLYYSLISIDAGLL